MANDNLPVEVSSTNPPSPIPLNPPSSSSDLSAFPSLPNPALSSLSQSPVFKSLSHGARGCVTCGHGADGRLLHRLKHDGAVRHHCSSCILFYNKGMYCSQCFQVYRDASQLGDPALWLTCCKCLRLSHLGCVRKRASSSPELSDFSCFTCQDCCDPGSRWEFRASKLTEGLCTSTAADGRETLSPHKNMTQVGDVEGKCDFTDPTFQDLSVQDQEALAAANIVAALAANEAKEAKTRAGAMAAAAVKAATRAKAALDAAYRAAREEAKWKVEASGSFQAISGQPTQATGGTQSAGLTISEKRKLETLVGNIDHSGQSAETPNQEELARNLRTVSNAPRSPRSGVASYKRRTLSAIAASEATRTHPSSCVGSQHGSGLFTPQHPRNGSLPDLRQHGSLSSAQEGPDQIHEDPEHGLIAGPVVLADGLGLGASPASILESSTLLGTPRADAVVSISETDAGRKLSCSASLPGNESIGNSQVPISRNGLVISGGDLPTDGSNFFPRLISGNHPVTGMCGVDGKLTNQTAIEELRTFSPGPDGGVTDDLVDLGALLPGVCERETKLSIECVPIEGNHTIEGNPDSLGSSVENTLVSENTSAGLPKPKTDAVLGAIPSTVITLSLEHPSGSNLAGEQVKQGYEENDLLGNKPFLQKVQRPILLNMSVSNQGEKPLPYSVVKASVGTSCSLPLQTTALAGVSAEVQ